LKPPLKWAGGKRWIVPYLEPLWRKSRKKRLVEPLCGGLAVALGLMPGKALLNDINIHLINFYRWLKKGLYLDLPMENEQDFYYSCRNQFNRLIAEGDTESSKAASLFYYLNRTGYNGLCRFNKKGFFNVPFGRYAQINYRRDFSEYKKVFKGWEFKAIDFEQLELGQDDFIYADPPYDVEFTGYTAHGFGWDDQLRFARWLALQQGSVVGSNQATKRIITLYSDLGFQLNYLSGPRMISCDGNRIAVREILASRGF
jgi:DNA adenine methylase